MTQALNILRAFNWLSSHSSEALINAVFYKLPENQKAHLVNKLDRCRSKTKDSLKALYSFCETLDSENLQELESYISRK